MLERMENEQLLAEIDRLLASENPEEMDVSRLEACLALLQQRCPVMADYDTEQAKVRLQSDHPELFIETKTPQSKRSVGWRFFPLAAVLALLLAICVGAYSFSSGWSFRYEKNHDAFVTGDRYATTSVTYGGSKLPEKTQQNIFDSMVFIHMEGGGHYVADFSFDSLAELEAFTGVDLIESDRFTISSVHCTAYFYDQPRQTFRIKGFYTLLSDDYACRIRFHLTTYPGAELSFHHRADETAYDFTEYPMDKLDINAAILSSTTDKTDIVAYWTKDRLAYELHGFGTQDDLTHMLTTLDILQ